ncbi:MAG: CapA family protein [Gemmatimonadota bacterium]|nr:CapA family protein [Gemmatimonadota bacterium]
MEPVTLFLCGDVMIGRGIDQVLPHSVEPVLHEPYVKDARRYVRIAEEASGPISEEVDYAYPWGAALAEIERRGPTHRVVNLETSLTAEGEPWPDKGIHYRSHPENVAVLGAAGVDACSLANNHVLDWGYQGLEATLRALDRAGIRATGAGLDVAAAEAPVVLQSRATCGSATSRRVLVFSVGAMSSGIPPAWAATDSRAGVAFLREISTEAARDLAARIADVRRPHDLVVVSIHWGGNWGYTIPDRQRDFARRLIDEGGVDVVHGHSSHHPKGIEVHSERLILYGCGDFLNDYEGIGGHEEVRPDLVLMYFPALDPQTGALRGMVMTPMRIRTFRLERASRDDAAWLAEVLERESLGTGIVSREDGRLEVG